MRMSLHKVIYLKMLFHLKALAPFYVSAFDTRQTIVQVPVCYFPQVLPSDVPS